MPARSGDCTRLRNRVSTSCGSTDRAAGGAAPRRALKVRSSIYPVSLSADRARLNRGAGAPGPPGGTGSAAVVLGLVSLDQVLDPDRVRLVMSVADDGVRPAAGFNQDVGQHHARVDIDGRHVGHVDRLLLLA